MTNEIEANSWHVFVNPPAMTVHTRDVGGVLCRWWGDGPVPAGVALIDAAAALHQQADGSIDSDCRKYCQLEADEAAHLARTAAPSEGQAIPRVLGVSRDAESSGEKGVLVAFERRLTDDELRAFHVGLSKNGGAA